MPEMESLPYGNSSSSLEFVTRDVNIQIVDISGYHVAILDDLAVEAEAVGPRPDDRVCLPYLRLVVGQVPDFKCSVVIPAREVVPYKGWIDVSWEKSMNKRLIHDGCWRNRRSSAENDLGPIR